MDNFENQIIFSNALTLEKKEEILNIVKENDNKDSVFFINNELKNTGSVDTNSVLWKKFVFDILKKNGYQGSDWDNSYVQEVSDFLKEYFEKKKTSLLEYGDFFGENGVDGVDDKDKAEKIVDYFLINKDKILNSDKRIIEQQIEELKNKFGIV